eukprot:5571317-Pleurochrysis_carterae.AAC.2
MAAFLDWPSSGRLSYTQVDRPGTLKPIVPVFSGNYTEFNAVTVNCAVTTDGSVPIRMTGEDKQEWGAVNPDKPNQWVIAETGLGRQLEVCLNADPELCPHGELSSTLAFLEANFAEALANVESSTIESRNGNKLPESIVAKNFHVMADQVMHLGSKVVAPAHGSSPRPINLSPMDECQYIAGIDYGERMNANMLICRTPVFFSGASRS